MRNIAEFKALGEVARLIPVVADSKKEERATSCLLASFMVAPLFAQEVLSEAGAPVGKRIKVSCWTEVVFQSRPNSKSPRPDGLIIIKSGTKTWTALVESKIGNNELTQDQVEEYLDLAKDNGINALITISNQFATTPNHHPLKVSKSKLRSVELYHFSWISLKSKALLLTKNKQVEDPEQAYILSELVRYMSHVSSGITPMTQMPSDWKSVCTAVQQKNVLPKTSEIIVNCVSGWHQLLRHLALELTMAVRQPVNISLSRARAKDLELNFKEDCQKLSSENCLTAEFDIQNAAANISLTADFARRSLEVGMKLKAPADKHRATASINWLTRQLKGKETSGLSIRVYWPKRLAPTTMPLDKALEDPALLIPENTKELPKYIEVYRLLDLAVRFKGARTFVDETSREFPQFYKDVGENLTKWIAQAPKIKESKSLDPVIPTVFTSLDVMVERSSQITASNESEGAEA